MFLYIGFKKKKTITVVIEKINKILFTFNSKLASVSEIQKEYGSEKEEQNMFFIELDPDVAELGCAS